MTKTEECKAENNPSLESQVALRFSANSCKKLKEIPLALRDAALTIECRLNDMDDAHSMNYEVVGQLRRLDSSIALTLEAVASDLRSMHMTILKDRSNHG